MDEWTGFINYKKELCGKCGSEIEVGYYREVITWSVSSCPACDEKILNKEGDKNASGS